MCVTSCYTPFYINLFFFFFQAEDGIRDADVTGVQTCALPIYDLVEETKTTFEYLQKRSSKLIEFQLDIPENPIYVQMNPQLYSWTIENLVKNGIDAMRGKGKISISIAQNSRFAYVHISDTGKGLTKSEFRRIFTPGHTTKKRGWGLGLSLAKRIIEEYHKGKIRVLKSVPNEGTTMEIALKTNV